MEERRKLERFALNLPASIRAIGSVSRTLDLVTQNISAGGAFFLTDNPLPKGLKVLMELVLKRESGLGKAAKLKINGKVIRSQPDGMAIMFMDRLPAVVG